MTAYEIEKLRSELIAARRKIQACNDEILRLWSEKREPVKDRSERALVDQVQRLKTKLDNTKAEFAAAKYNAREEIKTLRHEVNDLKEKLREARGAAAKSERRVEELQKTLGTEPLASQLQKAYAEIDRLASELNRREYG